MMRTLLWKEYREHRLIWLVMVAVNCGVLLGMSMLLSSGAMMQGAASKLSTLGPVAALLVWGYGMICGAMLLAGEREEATLNFLDTLPVSRLHLWLTKAFIGCVLVVAQTLVLSVVLMGVRVGEGAVVLGGVDMAPSMLPFVLGMLLMGVIGMAYALFFSARGENVLHTIGLGILGNIFAGFAAAFLGFALSLIYMLGIFWLSRQRHVGPMNDGTYAILNVCAFLGLTLLALAGSARSFSRTDQQRRPAAVRRMRARPSLLASLLRLVWLSDRQMRRLALGVLAFSLGLGVLFLVVGPMLWPVATLLLGVLCGVTIFADEQASGSFRFLGDQRLPLGRIWIIKTGMRFALLLLASFVLLLPSLLVALFHRAEHSSQGRREWTVVIETLHLNLIVEVVPVASYLLLWPLYGFGAGLLCGFLSRKSIVAAMIAFMTAAGLVIVWVPSLAGVGLHFWQVAGAPLVLVIASALLMRAWAADRLASWRYYVGISAALVGALGWIAFGLWYRVIEVPNVPEPFDVEAYRTSLPPPEKNEAGQKLRGAWTRVDSVARDMYKASPKKPLAQQSIEVTTDGWPDGKSELGEWLDKTFAEDWLGDLAKLPDLPLGMAVDPRLYTLHDQELVKWHNARTISLILAARGLQQQSRGDPAVFVDHLRIALAVSRNLQHHSPSLVADAGRWTAQPWPGVVDLWLGKLRGRPDLLKRALQILIDHEAQLPDPEESNKADYVVASNTLSERPDQLMGSVVPEGPKEGEAHRQAELQLAAALWFVPWEQTRHQRLLNLQFSKIVLTSSEQRDREEWGGNVFNILRFFGRPAMENQALRRLAQFRACQLKVALRLYQAENGRLPDTLDALVPRYVKALPRDPFDRNGQGSFHYRVSTGEEIIWSPDNQPGQQEAAGGALPRMPLADEPVAAVPPVIPVAPMGGAAGGAGMPGPGDEAHLVDLEPPPGGVPPMPRADEPVVPPPVGQIQMGAGQPPPGGPMMQFAGGADMPGGRPQARRNVPKGQGILWSVGEDGHDDSGKEQGMHLQNTLFGQDLIYLVPPPPD